MQKCIARCAEKEKETILIATDATRTQRKEVISRHTCEERERKTILIATDANRTAERGETISLHTKGQDETTDEKEEGKEGNPYTTNARRIRDNPFEAKKYGKGKIHTLYTHLLVHKP